MSRRRSAAATAVEEPVLPPPPVEVPPSTYLRVDVTQLFESELNPRKRLDEDSLRDLAESIRQHDVLEPLVVRAPGLSADEVADLVHQTDTRGYRFEIVAGSRRHKAAKLAGRTVVPVMVRVVTDAQLLELALQENMQRAGMSPLEEARALDQLKALDPIYRDDKILAGKIGRSETYVRDRLKLLKLAPIVIAALEADAITAKHAERIARLSLDIQALALAACFRDFLLDVVETTEHKGSTISRRVSLAELVEAGRWTDLAPALGTLRDLDDWVEEHGKVDVQAPEIQEQLRPALEELFTSGHVEDEDRDAAFKAATAELLQLSADYLDRETAAALRVIPNDLWRLVDEKHPCEHARAALIVHGRDGEDKPITTPQVVQACIERKHCRTHWPKPKKAASSSAPRYDYKAEEEKRAQREREWKAAWPHYRDALVARTKGAKFTTAALQRAWRDLTWTSQTFGVPVTDANLGQLVALSGVRTNYLEYFKPDAQKLGLNVDKVTAQIKAAAAKKEAPASGSAEKRTNAKKTAARDVLRKNAPAGARKALAKKGAKKR